MSDAIEVRGAASAEEIAAVLAVLARSDQRREPLTGYARWRATRLRALRQ